MAIDENSVYNINGKQLNSFRKLIQAGQKWKADHMATTEATVEKAIRSLEVGAASFAMGVTTGRVGKPIVLMDAVPVDLLAGVVLNGASLFNFAGKHSAHLGNIGDGMLAHWAGMFGRGIGSKWKEEGIGSILHLPGKSAAVPGRGDLPGASVHGALPEGSRGGQSLTDAEYRRLSQSV